MKVRDLTYYNECSWDSKMKLIIELKNILNI